MIDGIITLSHGGNNLYGRIVWQAESNGTRNNNSTVTAKVQLHRQAGFTTTGTWKGSINIGGKTSNISYYGSIGSDWVTVKALTVDVGHNNDGTGSCYLYAKVHGPSGTSLEGTYVSGSKTVELEYIARYASIVAVTPFTDETNPVITYENPAGETVESISVAVSIDSETPISDYQNVSLLASSYTYELSDVVRDKLLEAATTATALTVHFILRSYIEGIEGHTTFATTMNIVNARPTIAPVIFDTNEDTVRLTGDSTILVATQSVASVTVNAVARKKATIKSIRVEHGSEVLYGDGSLNITNSPIKITVLDSRNYEESYIAPNTIIPYFSPTCIVENAMPNALGELPLVASGIVYDGTFGITNNNFVIKYRFCSIGSDYSDWFVFAQATLKGLDYVAEQYVTGLDYKKTYTFQAAIFDSVHTEGVVSESRRFVTTPIFHWSQNDFSFNVPVYYLNKLLEEWFLNKSGDTMQGILNMGGNRIVGLPEPVHATDVVTKSYADKSTQIQKVWENEDPSQAVGKQTLEVDLSGFQMVAIEYQFNTTTPRTKMAFGAIGSQVALDFISKEFNMGLRICVPYANKVEIQTAAYSASSADPDKYMIPTRIFGIKGIGGIEVIRAICGTFVCGAVIAGQ